MAAEAPAVEVAFRVGYIKALHCSLRPRRAGPFFIFRPIFDALDLVGVEAVAGLNFGKHDVALLECQWVQDWFKERAVIWMDFGIHGPSRGPELDATSSLEIAL